ncbi:hypothetical protein [Nocardioides sp. SYSU D00065]|uniref:hypothetical protein n=1 Tax=Nocardioides sp. SYSU D00065 TaxID=2817378 RepID=UPI001B33D2AC|nr:hypothetical protein [Nocardioides sp. SYSU D00065]
MPTFYVTTDRPQVPAARFAAEDLVDLGEQVASHLARHRVLSRAVPFHAQVGDDHGAIHQSGLLRPVTFTITQES